MVTIRTEEESDQRQIWEITKSAFEGKAYAGGDEQDLIDRLRDQGLLVVSLVATDDSKIIGQISFSPATISSDIGKWYALGPVSVLPVYQCKGIGGLLIENGIERLKELEAWGCILTGDTRYYSRHGFELAGQHCPENEPRENFMLRAIGGKKPDGVFSFHQSFYDDGA